MLDHERKNPYNQVKFDNFPPEYTLIPSNQITAFSQKFRYFNKQASPANVVIATFEFCQEYIDETMDERIGMI